MLKAPIIANGIVKLNPVRHTNRGKLFIILIIKYVLLLLF